MAKAFSEQERKRIETALLATAERFMGTRGIQKTSVDELVAAAGISKGAFYAFFRSKEELFFRVIMQFHERVEGDFMRRLSALNSPGADQFTGLILDFFHDVDSSFYPGLLSSGELERLFRSLPEDLVALHEHKDADLFSGLGRIVPGLGSIDAEAYSAAFRAIFLLLLHKKDIGEASFEKALLIIVSGTVRRMFDEPSPAEERK